MGIKQDPHLKASIMNLSRLSRSTLGLTGLALSSTLLLAACGGGSDAASTDAPSSDGGSETATVETLAAGEKLSANTATEEELQSIPGVGEEIAHEITEYRPYDAATGEAKFREELAKYIDDDAIDGIVPYLDFSE